MGKHLRPGTQSCWDFTPDDTDTKKHILSGCDYSLQDLMDIAKKHWPDATPDDIKITSEKIHTRAIYYDLHDGGDWDDYIILELKT